MMYKLDSVSDNPLFEGFAFKRDKSLRGTIGLSFDFDPDAEEVQRKGRGWQAPRLAAVWVPQTVEGRVRPFNDYPCINLTVPAFSKRAVEVLREFLEPNGELLPLKSKIGEYYAYNVTRVADVLDLGKSKIKWLDKKQDIALDIFRYETQERKLRELSIFRIVEEPSTTFVTSRFVERVEEHGLIGFHFAKVWPLPPGVSWEKLDKRREKKTNARKQPITGNTVVVSLALHQSRATRTEKSRIAEVEDAVDALLVQQEYVDSPYFGSLEGEDYVDGQCRLFFSCPDANILADKLLPWFRNLEWDGKVQLLKRYGEYTDPDAREVCVEVK